MYIMKIKNWRLNMKIENLMDSILEKDKRRILKSDKEYCFIECYYHGSPKIVLTNDNNGRHMSKAEKSAGMEFLLLLSECQEYLKG